MPDNYVRIKRIVKALRDLDRDGLGAPGGMGASATERLAGLDAFTEDYRVWNPRLIPGVLQTDAYAACTIRRHTPELTLDEIGARLLQRTQRRDAFLAHRAEISAPAWFLIGEAAITHPVTTTADHVEQLRHLLDIEQRYPNVAIQVLPQHAADPVEPFETFALATGLQVGHIELFMGGWYTVGHTGTSRLHRHFSEMIGCAHGTADSRAFISEVLTCWEATVEPTSSSPPTPIRAPASTLPGPQPALLA